MDMQGSFWDEIHTLAHAAGLHIFCLHEQQTDTPAFWIANGIMFVSMQAAMKNQHDTNAMIARLRMYSDAKSSTPNDAQTSPHSALCLTP